MDELSYVKEVATRLHNTLNARPADAAAAIRYPIAPYASRESVLALRDEVKRLRPADTVTVCCDSPDCENEFAWIEVLRNGDNETRRAFDRALVATLKHFPPL